MESHKTFRDWQPQQYAQRPIAPTDVLPENDLVFFLLDAVPRMNLSPIYRYYERETRGAPPFDVAMMCTLIFYAYSVGVFSSRKIAAACERNLAFLAIVGDYRPDFRTISEFRHIHLDPLADLFVEVLRIAGKAGMVKLGNLAIDGSKFRANASRHKAMSYGYMKKEVARLRQEMADLLQQAEQVDAEQDAAMGSRRGDELPDELKRREARLAVIEEAMRRLEEEAKADAEAQRREREQAEAERAAQGKPPRGRPAKPISDEPEDRAQTNFTDPESKIMKTANKGFDYCYNPQTVVDEEHQIILTAEVTPAANDKQQAVPMAEKTLENLNAAGIDLPREESQPDAAAKKIPLCGDNGYFSEEAVGGLEGKGFDPYLATGRQKHHAASPTEAAGPPPAEATVKEQMAHKLRTPEGRKRYAKRKQIVEPVFGQIKHGRGFRQFLLRGLKKVSGEWKLLCLTHNLLKIWHYRYALT
jgi:transposase